MSNTKYLVAARKYRPQLFDDVVAQHHVTETLKNAIRMDRLAHAYLFSGPRGVGKTTVARILAKSINCQTPLEDRKDIEPCETCDSCTSINEGRSLNVIEIDAASNNKVDDVRELRDTVRIPPQGARKKVYIVDEVHMLSNAAFNAFLKTLEEPPSYALFIFATTEPQKVIPTILSRCQRFDFKRIPVKEIVSRLEEIAKAEDIIVDDASLMLIAQKGDGALRDALSVFDQAVSLCGSTLTYQELAKALRVVDQDLFFKTTAQVRNQDSAGILDLVEHITGEGYDLKEFLSGLAGHIRNLLVAVTTDSGSLIEETDDVRAQYLQHSTLFTEAQLLRVLMILANTEDSLLRSSQPRLALELGLLKMVASIRSLDLREAVARLDVLEKKVAAAPPMKASSAQQITAVESSTNPNTETNLPQDTVQSAKPIERRPPQAAERKQPRKVEPKAPVKPPKKTGNTEPDVAQTDEVSAPPIEKKVARSKPALSSNAPGVPPNSLSEVETSPDTPASPETLPSGPGLFGPPALKKKSNPRNSAVSDADQPSIEGSLAVSRQRPARVPDSIEALWLKYVSTVKSLRIHVGSLLQHGAPIDVRGQAVLVAIPDDFHRRLLDNQHEFLLKHLNAASEKQYKKIEFVVREIEGDKFGETKKEEFDPYEYMKRKRQESPIVKSIFEDFGGELVW